jgi:multidrug efflux pump subunit AcrB
MNRLIAYFAQQSIFVNLITVFLVIFGIFSVAKIRREVFPNINFDIITVTTALPGASAESIERLITNRLEQDLREVDGIKKMTSVSADNQSVIVLQLDPDEVSDVKAERDIQDVIDNFRDLPEAAEDPIVTLLESKRRPTVEVSISGAVAERILRDTAKSLEDSIENIPEVAKVQFNGLRDLEIRVDASSEKLKKYQVSLADLINALKASNISVPGGPIDAQSEGESDMIIRTVGEFDSLEDVKQTVVRANTLAEPIYVSDVAEVIEDFERAKILQRTNGKSSISLTALKKESADAIILVDKLRAVLADVRPQLAAGIEVDLINDSSYFVRRRLSVLTGNLAIGLVLVLCILGLVLPFRIALLVSIGIPFSFLGTMGFFYGTDIGLNLISMMGLIIVVGMLVDDAVVVTENCQSYIEKGMDPTKAATLGAQTIWAPLTASVMTTVAAFLPLMFMSGIFGKFIRFIPLGVIAALLVSLFQGFFILPNHFATVVKTSSKPLKGVMADYWVSAIERPYIRMVEVLLRRRYVVLISFIVFLGGSLIYAKHNLSFVLFPKGAIEAFVINVETPTGSPLERTSEVMKTLEGYVAKLPEYEMKNFVTRIGRQNLGNQRSKSGSSFAQITVYLTAKTERESSAGDIIERLRAEVGAVPGVKRLTYEALAGGPPVGKPVSIGVRGLKYSDMMLVVEDLKKILETIEGVSDVQDNFINGKNELQIHVNSQEAAASGLNVRDIGTIVRAAFEGVVPTSIKTLDEEVDIRVSLSKDKSNAEALKNLKIPNSRGQLIPLERVASIEDYQGLATYEHEANRRQVRVTAEVDTKVTSALEVNRLIKERTNEIAKNNREISFSYGGEDADTKESLRSLGEAFAFALLGILFLLILLYKNIYQPFLIATTIPMGAIAVLWAFILHGMPMSFLGMIGLISLAGVIVNNAIVLLDFVNRARAGGANMIDSIREACAKRIRPIFLTTVTTVAGILPTAYGIGGLDPFVVPVALSLGWGLFVGSILTAIVFPGIIAIADDIVIGGRRLARYLWASKSTGQG